MRKNTHCANDEGASAAKFLDHVESEKCAAEVDGAEDDLSRKRVVESTVSKMVVPKLRSYQQGQGKDAEEGRVIH